MQELSIELVNLKERVRSLNKGLKDRSRCYYCNEPSEAEDHVIPHSLFHHINERRTGRNKDTLPACQECNVLLSSNVFDSLEQRRAYISNAYRKRYAKELKTKPWTNEEFKSLSYNLRASAEYKNDLIRRACARIEYIERDNDIDININRKRTNKKRTSIKRQEIPVVNRSFYSSQPIPKSEDEALQLEYRNIIDEIKRRAKKRDLNKRKRDPISYYLDNCAKG